MFEELTSRLMEVTSGDVVARVAKKLSRSEEVVKIVADLMRKGYDKHKIVDTLVGSGIIAS